MAMELPLAPQEIGLSAHFKDFCCGALGGMAGVVAGQPLDTLRIRMQQQTAGSASASAVWRAMAGKEGIRGLFKGITYPLYSTSLQNAVTFQAQRAAFRSMACWSSRQDSHLQASSSHTPMANTMAAGMFAGAVQSFISCPVELLKIRQQLQHSMPGSPGYVGPAGMLQQVLRNEGAQGLLRGFGSTLLRDTPSYGLYFCAYTWTVDVMQAALANMPRLRYNRSVACLSDSSIIGGGGSSSSSSSGPSAAVQFMGGGIAGMVAWFAVYPIDVIKTRLQAQPAGLSPYRSAYDCVLVSLRNEGPGVFTKGLSTTMARAFLVNAVIFAGFETSLKLMDSL